MKPELLFALKKIAELGGIEDWIEITSKELGDQMDKSQQCASLYINELLELEMLLRLPGKKAKLKLTDKGKKELLQLYEDLGKILHGKTRIEITGYVTKGLGEGKFYIGKEQYSEQIFENFGFKPFPGTLNLKLEKESLSSFLMLREKPGILLRGFVERDRTYGNVKCFKATVQELMCIVVIPERSHHTDIMEVVSKHNLRSLLDLKDGDRVIVRVEIDGR
ncbi:MAG: DUF120 domain-containing protein [Thermoplasmata archaeon]|nr:DUF120 domain-containing protein [Thermoplasmata archaeon]